jgi:hypothetical protein
MQVSKKISLAAPWANQWYTKAMNATKDKQLKALCFFMAQHCNENWDYYGQLVKNWKNPVTVLLSTKNLRNKKALTWKPTMKSFRNAKLIRVL